MVGNVYYLKVVTKDLFLIFNNVTMFRLQMSLSTGIITCVVACGLVSKFNLQYKFSLFGL